VGRELGPPVVARDPVNQSMIRHWCDAIGDANPVYTDPEAAAASVHGGVVAPPTMLQAWSMRGLEPTGSKQPNVQDELMAVLNAAGFSSVVATNCDQAYARYLKPGDVITISAVIDAVSVEKHTALGDGHFVTTKTTFSDQHGDVVGTMTFRILKFRPAASGGAASPSQAARRPRPAINRDNAFFWEGIDRAELLIQRCASCGRLRHPPGPMCPSCRSLEWDTVVSSGRGSVYSFVVPHHPQVAAFEYPYVVALVQLEEGTRLVSNVVGVEPEDVHVGMPVAVEFVAVDDELTLPQFRPTNPVTATGGAGDPASGRSLGLGTQAG
jgi:uncharacterized OB-fold protein/acyl dehydratase